MMKFLLPAFFTSLAALTASAAPNDAVEVGGLYFSFDKTAKTATLESKAYATNQFFYEGDITVPATVDWQGETYTVTTIGEYAFSDYDENLTSVTLPETITTIVSYAFDGTVLTELTIPNSVKTIGANVFEYSELRKITLGSGLESIGANAFYRCSSLTEVYALGETPCEITGTTFPAAVKANATLHVPAGSVAAYQSSADWSGFKDYQEIAGQPGPGPDPSVPVDVLYNGILYEVTPADGTARVATVYTAVDSGRLSEYYSGDITIADKVPYNGEEYTVSSLGDECFWQCKLTSIQLPETLEKLGWESFYNILTLPEIVIPDKVAVIEHGDFIAAGIRDITLGAGVTTIEYSAFENMNLITTMTVKAPTPPSMHSSAISAANKAKTDLFVPKGCVDAYKAAPDWSGFKSYKEIKAPIENPMLIDGIYYTLSEREYDKEPGTLQASVAAPVTGFAQGDEYQGDIVIPDFITYDDQRYVVMAIDWYAFRDQTLVTSVTLPGTVTKIGNSAFDNTSITKITLPESVTSLENYVFRKCSKLTEITVENPVPPTVTASTFDSNITSACRLYVPKGCVETYRNTAYWSAFSEILENPDAPVRPEQIILSRTHATRLVDDVFTLTATILPADADDKSVEWKSLNPEVAEVDAEGNVTIKAAGRANIEAISQGNRTLSAICVVHAIDRNVTVDGLSYRLELDEDNKIYDAYVIRADYGGNIVIPSQIQAAVTFSVAGIDQNAFALNSNVTSVSIPSSVRSIGFNAFRECTGLQRVDITNISAWCNIDFRDKLANPVLYSGNLYLNGTPVTDINIGAGMEQIKNFVFEGMTSLKSVVIADGLKSIGEYAFAGCTGITEVVLPESVESIGMSAFSDCTQLASVNLPSGLDKIATGILARTAISSISVPEGVTYIDNQAFQGCARLSEVSLPSTLEEIYMLVFDKCPALSEITCLATVPPTFFQAAGFGEYALAFDPAIFATCKIRVPAEAVDAYRAAPGWRNFVNIMDLEAGTTGEKAEVDGLWYEFFSDKFTATLVNDPGYSGEITVPAKVTREGAVYDVTAVGEGAFENLASVTSVTLPESVTSIGARALYGTGIDVFAVPQGVSVISDEMLAACHNLISVSLPDRLERIGIRAFYDSPRIRYIFCNNTGFGPDHTVPSFTTFEGDPTDYGQAFSTEIWPDCMLVIPADMFMNYKSNAGWKNFRNWAYWHDYDVMPEAFTMNPDRVAGPVDAQFSVTPTVEPAGATVLTYILTGLDETIATIAPSTDDSEKTSYNVRLNAEGETTVTVYCGLLKAECLIVCDNSLGVSGIADDNDSTRWFDLNGHELKSPVKGQPMIRVRDGKAEKVIIL